MPHVQHDDGVVTLLVGHRTCDSQVMGSSPGQAPQHSGLRQATYACVPLSPSSIIGYKANGSYAFLQCVKLTVTEMTINGNKSNPLTVTVTVTEKFH